MPELTTKDALWERMVAATEKLKNDIPAKFDEYLPLTGGKLTGTTYISNSAPELDLSNTSLTRGETIASNADYGNIWFVDKDDKGCAWIHCRAYTDGDISLRFTCYNSAGQNRNIEFTNGSDRATFAPLDDNYWYLGNSSRRWKEVYSATSTINTSDERLKHNIEPIPDEVIDAWGEVCWCQYQFKDAVAEKGNNARLHTGAIAQRIKSVFEAHKIDPFKYGLLCYDEWEADDEREAGNIYSMRYEEALCMEAAYQRRRADKLEERIEALERALNV